MTKESQVRVQVNGEERTVPAGLTVEGLLHHFDLHPRLVVVERNGEILRHEVYSSIDVSAGDALELVHFVGGG